MVESDSFLGHSEYFAGTSERNCCALAHYRAPLDLSLAKYQSVFRRALNERKKSAM